MDKNKLQDLVKNERFISGIYNYCDRWCERCPQTSRCLNYSFGEEEFADPESRDINNEAFWKKMSGILKDTLDLIMEKAAREGIDLNALDLDEVKEETRSVMEAADDHEISRAAMAYGRMAEDWFNEAGAYFGEEEPDADRLAIAGKNNASEKDDLQDAVEVISWYQHQIYVKLMRAISGLMEEAAEGSDGPDEFARDSDGSAKVALIGIDRSIAAWGIIHNRIPSIRNHSIRSIMIHLDKLRRRIEKDFPDARVFVRPGFDTVNLNS